MTRGERLAWLLLAAGVWLAWSGMREMGLLLVAASLVPWAASLPSPEARDAAERSKEPRYYQAHPKGGWR